MQTNSTNRLVEKYGVFDPHLGYRLIPVFEQTDDETRRLIIDLWERNQILPPGTDAQARAKQVVFMALDTGGTVVAVNTVFTETLAHTGLQHAPPGEFFFYRTFIQPRDRVPNLVRKMFVSTYDYLRGIDMPNKPQGLVTVAQNPKLGRRGVQISMKKLGWDIPGRDLEGNVIYRRDF